MHINGKLCCLIQRKHVPADVRDPVSTIIVEIDSQKEQPLFRFWLEDKLFSPMNLHHTIGVAEHVGSDQ